MDANDSIPPKALNTPLEVTPGEWPEREFYLMMTALVVPRPIGWISTISAAGVRNVAPYSYFNLMGSDPFFCAFGSTGVKDSLSNIREVPQFVCNIVTMHVLEKMNFTSADYPREQDEFDWAGLTPVPSVKVRPPRVGEAKAHLECELVQVVSERNSHVVIGRVVHVHVDPSVWKEGRVDPRLLDPVCRLSGSLYANLGEIYSVPRPAWDDLQGSRGQEKMPKAVKR
jgi:flavin reductase (DIM6/NTAB) family NADH-FMN oxidoreductase RutF